MYRPESDEKGEMESGPTLVFNLGPDLLQYEEKKNEDARKWKMAASGLDHAKAFEYQELKDDEQESEIRLLRLLP
jgi:hypothetical protein